jgi:hypothetical protein
MQNKVWKFSGFHYKLYLVALVVTENKTLYVFRNNRLVSTPGISVTAYG